MGRRWEPRAPRHVRSIEFVSFHVLYTKRSYSIGSSEGTNECGSNRSATSSSPRIWAAPFIARNVPDASNASSDSRSRQSASHPTTLSSFKSCTTSLRQGRIPFSAIKRVERLDHFLTFFFRHSHSEPKPLHSITLSPRLPRVVFLNAQYAASLPKSVSRRHPGQAIDSYVLGTHRTLRAIVSSSASNTVSATFPLAEGPQRGIRASIRATSNSARAFFAGELGAGDLSGWKFQPPNSTMSKIR